MGQFRLTPQAVSELDGIWSYIAQDSPEAARRMVRRIRAACQKVADMPGQGKRRDDLAAGLRSFREGKYLIFYRVSDAGIQVVHIYHGARNLKKPFGAE